MPASARELHEVEGAMSVVPGQLKLPRWGKRCAKTAAAAPAVVVVAVCTPHCIHYVCPLLPRTASFKFLERAAVRTKPAGAAKERLVTLTEASPGVLPPCGSITFYGSQQRTVHFRTNGCQLTARQVAAPTKAKPLATPSCPCPCPTLQVEEVKCVLRLLPVAFTLICYYAIYGQTTTMFILQVSSRLGRWRGAGDKRSCSPRSC